MAKSAKKKRSRSRATSNDANSNAGKPTKAASGKRSSPADRQPYSVAPVLDVLHSTLTEEMCRQVHDDLRTKERLRKWTLYALSRFWTAVVLEAPPSLTHALELGRGPHKETHALLPNVDSGIVPRPVEIKEAAPIACVHQLRQQTAISQQPSADQQPSSEKATERAAAFS